MVRKWLHKCPWNVFILQTCCLQPNQNRPAIQNHCPKASSNGMCINTNMHVHNLTDILDYIQIQSKWICMPSRHRRWGLYTIRQRPQSSGEFLWHLIFWIKMQTAGGPQTLLRMKNCIVHPSHSGWKTQREALVKSNADHNSQKLICYYKHNLHTSTTSINNIIWEIGYLVVWNIKQIPHE